jgi:diguanylate cyclase (GGDEF)-like protein
MTMREFRNQTLHKLWREFQRFPFESMPSESQRWALLPKEVDDLLAHALQYACKTRRVDRAAVFLLNDQKRSLLARQIVDSGDVLSGEEEIPLMVGSSLHQLIEGHKSKVVLDQPLSTLFLPLKAFGQIFGALRFESRAKKRFFDKTMINDFEDFAHELATALRGMELAATERQQLHQLQAWNQVSNAIFRSLRLEEMLLSVAHSLIHQMGFDRAKIFLINKDGDLLEKFLSVDQRRRQDFREKEQYPMRLGVHPMVDMILGKVDDERIERFQRTIVYLPLRTRDENLGILMVDNLLSQQEISPGEIPILQGIAGQLSMAIKNARLFQGVEELSITDGLTGLYLLRYFKQRLKEEFFRAERNGGNLSLMIMDIDHFKRFNDSYGHQAGDTVLTTVAERILANARKVDLTARYGGDEFIILLPDTSSEEALLLADRLYQAISKEPVTLAGQPVTITTSLGIATFPTHASSIEELIKRSDEALYWVKSHGRNRFRLFSPEILAKK